ncbi:MAG: HAD-IC family P-type ATPase, partial [Terriglobales bacterium]
AAAKVIVKRLSAIESFGGMNVLCSDKTGTITEGKVVLQAAIDVEGNNSDEVFQLAYINSLLETGFVNPVDEAIRSFKQLDVSQYNKLDELPYDFVRKRLSILVANGSEHTLITKGALDNVLDVCSRAVKAGVPTDIAAVKAEVLQLLQVYSHQGYRVLGVAKKDLGAATEIDPTSEKEMLLVGLLVFADPPKEGIAETIAELNALGIALKIITGDNRWVATTVGKKVGFAEPRVLGAAELNTMSDAALLGTVNNTDIFAEVEPNQKERIIIALKKAGNVVGYIGDGINDASALHAADVGISVNNAVDVAKEAAELVMLDHDLKVLVQGVREGRITFANTMKYIFMATSANFGNMFSMAGASLFLPFLPLLPKQILLTNLLTDFPEMTIVTDNVDKELVGKPGRWNIGFIRRFMLIFGTLSSVFDLLTFVVLCLLLHAKEDLFRTGWFVESVVSSAIIVLVIRTRRSIHTSHPSKQLFVATLTIALVTVALPFTPIAPLLGFQPLPLQFIGWLALIVALYVTAAEAAKK